MVLPKVVAEAKEAVHQITTNVLLNHLEELSRMARQIKYHVGFSVGVDMARDYVRYSGRMMQKLNVIDPLPSPDTEETLTAWKKDIVVAETELGGQHENTEASMELFSQKIDDLIDTVAKG